ncbi:MAG: alpha/beta hydrolase [Sphingomonadaceae bacterium]|jgi:pimeloyl-ACP methyl ester carboxylesterase|nr:alpha/beta hydrolase [Sphingomonadaceae bacterium]
MAPLLLLHGAPGDGRLWQPVIDRLPAGTRAVAPTLAYFGEAPWPDDGAGFGSELHAAEIIAAAVAQGEPVRLVAWSFSVLPALLAALRRPELFAALLVYEPGLPSWVEDEGELERFGADAGAAFGPIAGAVMSGDNAAAVALLFDASGGPGCFANLSPERRALYLQSAAMMPLLMGGGQPPTPVSASEIAALRVPLTVAMGSRTRPVFEVPSRGLARATGGTEPLIVAEADHMLPETAPERFAALIGEWMAGT